MDINGILHLALKPVDRGKAIVDVGVEKFEGSSHAAEPELVFQLGQFLVQPFADGRTALPMRWLHHVRSPCELITFRRMEADVVQATALEKAQIPPSFKTTAIGGLPQSVRMVSSI